MYQDKSWLLTTGIGSLTVKDTTSAHLLSKKDLILFPNLMGPKGGVASDADKTMVVEEVSHHESIRISLRRQHLRLGGTVTTTTARVLPLELVYSTVHVEALSRILSTANFEFGEDYHRISTRVVQWRERQKRRLMRALAHKQKKIFVDVDVGAPVLLVPEDCSSDSPMLIVDLGRLQFKNDGGSGLLGAEFDQWRLELSRIQILCSATYSHRGLNSTDVTGLAYSAKQHLIEPFSLDFGIETRVHGAEDDEKDFEAHIQVLASLPRLVVNVTSSAVRLLRRLAHQWDARKVEMIEFGGESREPLLPLKLSQIGRHITFHRRVEASPANSSSRRFDLKFVAPLLKFCVENDVDGRDCEENSWSGAPRKTRILDMALRGIEGSLSDQRSLDGATRRSWTAKLRALQVLDLYQGAGENFSHLVSSMPPDMFSGSRSSSENLGVEGRGLSSDLVDFRYDSGGDPGSKARAFRLLKDCDSGLAPRTLSVHFNELYVEWNPETLAALHVALNLPSRSLDVKSVGSESESTAFFDVEEDEFVDALSLDNRFAFTANESTSPGPDIASGDVDGLPISRHSLIMDADAMRRLFPWMDPGPESPPARVKLRDADPFLVGFELRKLRVNFNKESRHRRLLTAEMDNTQVHHLSGFGGGSATHASIGNLTFTDADSASSRTLYREILGLQTDQSVASVSQSSLFEMQLIRNPRSRSYVPCEEEEDDLSRPVCIDVSAGVVRGCDNWMKAHFSPMRFVYLQQLWFEIMDYFFEGITGYEVWGNRRPESLVVTEISSNDAPYADSFAFTRFGVVMESPVILIPVSYCSSDFVRLDTSSISFVNRYTCGNMRLVPNSAYSSRRQWFNNCDISFSCLSIHSWTGQRLTGTDDSVSSTISLNWPSGASAVLNVPKWQVSWRMDPVELSLCKDDYALIQNVLQHNIGEVSRHLDEWQTLQNLPPLVLERYKQDIMVHFGYDKKDVTPTTYEVNAVIPVVSFSFLRDKTTDATVRCANVRWSYRKAGDLVSRQQVACDVEVLDDSSGSVEVLLSSFYTNDPDRLIVPDLTYTSTTQTSGDNSKNLSISSCRINLVYSSWLRFARFFQELPPPNYLSPSEVIQVGDRWYKIGSKGIIPMIETVRTHPWISDSETTFSTAQSLLIRQEAPSYEFRMSLVRPSIVVGGASSALVLRADEVSYFHRSRLSLVERDFHVNGMRLLTRRRGRSNQSEEDFVVDSWAVRGRIRRCNGTLPCECPSHTTELECDFLRGRAAYSDLTVAVEVGLGVLRDVRDSDRAKPPNSAVANGVALSNDFPDRFAADSEWTLAWDGCELALVDDSGRHFASAQDLVIVALSHTDFSRKESVRTNSSARNSFNRLNGLSYSMRLSILSLDVMDCLQSSSSPFRNIAAIRGSRVLLPEDMGSADSRPTYGVVVTSSVDASYRYSVIFRSIELQYNPSLVIALQRFLGRLSKDTKLRFESVFIDTSTPAVVDPTLTDRADRVETSIVSATLEVHYLRACLNKEHQGRQLLEIVANDSKVHLERSDSETILTGHLGVIDAWENLRMESFGRNVFKAGEIGRHFLGWRYVKASGHALMKWKNGLPSWVTDLLEDDDELDDCLDVLVSDFQLVYVKEMSLELLDYLSNGMPGRGMGATSRAAKGFVHQRIQTRSFLNVAVDSSTVLIPQNRTADCGLVVHLGMDVL